VACLDHPSPRSSWSFDEVAEVVADLPDLLAAGFGLVRTAPSAATFRRIINATDPTVWTRR
jgi:hypothetical protein